MISRAGVWGAGPQSPYLILHCIICIDQPLSYHQNLSCFYLCLQLKMKHRQTPSYPNAVHELCLLSMEGVYLKGGMHLFTSFHLEHQGGVARKSALFLIFSCEFLRVNTEFLLYFNVGGIFNVVVLHEYTSKEQHRKYSELWLRTSDQQNNLHLFCKISSYAVGQ